MSAKDTVGGTELTAARKVRLRATGVQFDALSDELVGRLNELDDDEIAALTAIKCKLNEGLPDNLKAAADTVGGFVW